jgi:hypothetical protein
MRGNVILILAAYRAHVFLASSLSGVGRNVLLLLAYLTLPTW